MFFYILSIVFALGFVAGGVALVWVLDTGESTQHQAPFAPALCGVQTGETLQDLQTGDFSALAVGCIDGEYSHD